MHHTLLMYTMSVVVLQQMIEVTKEIEWDSECKANQSQTNGKQGKSKVKNLRKKLKLKKTKSQKQTNEVLTPKKSKRHGRKRKSSKYQRKQIDEKDSISDCEIIEQVTPLIILDDELTSSEIENHPNPTEESCITLDETVIKNATQDDPVAVVEVEDHSFFFIDNVPNVRFKTPIYSVEQVDGRPIEPIKETTPTNNNHPAEEENTIMSKQNKNIHNSPSTCLPKKRCNSLNNETDFQPNPQLSSTQFEIVPDLLDDSINTQESVLTLNSSTNENSESVTSVCTVTRNTYQQDNTSSIGGNVETNSTVKRKALGENQSDEPATKRIKDVVAVDEFVSDDDDAVVFVSETLNFDRPSTVGLQSNRHKKRSNRAEKRALKLKREAILRSNNVETRKAALQKALSFVTTNKNVPKKKAPKKILNKFKSLIRLYNVDDHLDEPSTSQSNNPAPKKNEMDDEEKLFAERPDLFEKRMVIIDGSNVARTFGRKDRSYSVKGIQICIEHFEKDGFNVKAVVPQMRVKKSLSTDPAALEKLNIAGKVVFTPCKNLPGNRSSSYDDRFILEIAERFDGAIVSNDNYADLLKENPKWDKIIHERVIGFSCLDDFIWIPPDPYGRDGKSLQMILHKRKPVANDSATKENTP